MRFFPPLPPAAFPPFLPISRMTSEIRSRLIASSYEERLSLPKTPSADHQRSKPRAPCGRVSGQTLERRWSFHKKRISHNKRAHGSLCILKQALRSVLP